MGLGPQEQVDARRDDHGGEGSSHGPPRPETDLVEHNPEEPGDDGLPVDSVAVPVDPRLFIKSLHVYVSLSGEKIVGQGYPEHGTEERSDKKQEVFVLGGVEDQGDENAEDAGDDDSPLLL